MSFLLFWPRSFCTQPVRVCQDLEALLVFYKWLKTTCVHVIKYGVKLIKQVLSNNEWDKWNQVEKSLNFFQIGDELSIFNPALVQGRGLDGLLRFTSSPTFLWIYNFKDLYRYIEYYHSLEEHCFNLGRTWFYKVLKNLVSAQENTYAST